MPEQVNCPACGAPVDLPATSCPYCSAALTSDPRNAPTILASAPPPLPRFASSAEAMDEIKALLRAGNKIGAVQVHRDYFGTSLAESKDAVDAIESDLNFQPVPPPVPSISADDEPPAFARPDSPGVEPMASLSAEQPPAWRKWAIGCAIAFVVFCCLCIVVPAIIAAVLLPAGM